VVINTRGVIFSNVINFIKPFFESVAVNRLGCSILGIIISVPVWFFATERFARVLSLIVFRYTDIPKKPIFQPLDQTAAREKFIRKTLYKQQLF